MKPAILFLFTLTFTDIFSQNGLVSIEDEIAFTSMPVKQVAAALQNKNGFKLVDSEYPSAVVDGRIDSTVYLEFIKEEGFNNEARYSRKINGSKISSGFSFTTTDENWYKKEIAKIGSLGFKLTDKQLESNTAHDAKIYENEKVTIESFYSIYPGSDQKFYTIDVIHF